VPRALIVGCGCHGRALGERLVSDGWQVRGTSRDPDALGAIDAAGLEAVAADPDRPGTILELCGDVTVVVWLLGSAAGDRDRIDAIHGPRLERLLEKLVDSPVRGFAYEAAGSVPPETLGEGRAIVERAAGTWRIPVAMIEGDRSEPRWTHRAVDSVLRMLAR
jgi:nucleoside-diphosphate-sugar epimerase